MSNHKDAAEAARIRTAVLHSAAKLFLEKGVSDTSVREIAQLAGISKSMLMYTFASKEDILLHLVDYVLDGQFTAAERLVQGTTEDAVLLYAAETTLQLYLAESSESIRNLYATAYTLPKTSEHISQAVAQKLPGIFGAYLPDLEPKDFYELEIATGGIIRSYMAVPCTLYFTIERKVARFLQAALRVYRLPEEKINEAISFVAQFDYPTIARQTVAQLLMILSNIKGDGHE